ncbi:tryptophan dimethylallyltransferase-domain-containing protein [Hypomontagnella monticulosa]|nr:tryptophan dimethylallyltransferase-domain-containing protein [Hypomontagnella monticulosa]
MLSMRKDPGVSDSPVTPLPLILSYGLRLLESLIYSRKPLPDGPKTAWQQVTSDIESQINRHERYWWQRSGYALAVLLENAGYSEAAQVKILEFFARRIMGNLGVANESGAQRWKSFMTDDNNPIELSWDWHTGVERPTVRFSMEPIGLGAGTPEDPRNERAAEEFKRSILQALPDTDMSWFDHFEAFFSEGMTRNSVEGHSSKVFWAFDLGEKEVTSKAYFFPGYRARATNQSNLEAISEAIASAPSCTPEKLGALNIFSDFVNETERLGRPPLELDMLAIDMIDCANSRLKIYFRNRQTDFRSVCETMSLGGRIAGHDMDVGLAELRRLWNLLFDRESESEDKPLGQANHRTGGILYNVEFRLGGKAPKAKIYIPVRHYARTDEHVMKSVSLFMDSQGSKQLDKVKVAEKDGDHGRKQPTAGRAESTSSTAYAKAFNTIFTDGGISASRGLHTYIACSIQSGGALRVVSYINPQEEKLRSAPTAGLSSLKS